MTYDDPGHAHSTPLRVRALASQSRRASLELAHHQIQTALTIIRSNVDLARIKIEGEEPSMASVAVLGHFAEIERAFERFLPVIHELRRWHDEMADPASKDDGTRISIHAGGASSALIDELNVLRTRYGLVDAGASSLDLAPDERDCFLVEFTNLVRDLSDEVYEALKVSARR